MSRVGSQPQPAIPAILAAFEKYEVVGMSEAHDLKDVDDLILSLIRHPDFSVKVNDIVVECGNSRYQPILDRYIAGEPVSFSDVQKVWRNTTQPMCGQSGFFEQLFPLIRSLNQSLPISRKLRVVAADPPIDWDQVHKPEDIAPFMERDEAIASIIESEVLSRQRKALILFGIFHLLHGSESGNAVTIYERDYPGRTFVISDLGYYGADQQDHETALLNGLNFPTLIRTNGSPLGSLSLSAFLPTPLTTDPDCNVVDEFDGKEKRAVSKMIDAFLYLGPQRLQLREPIPADIGLDATYMTEWLRRLSIMGLPGPKTLAELDSGIVAGAENPILLIPKLPDSKEFYPFIRQACLDRKAQSRH